MPKNKNAAAIAKCEKKVRKAETDAFVARSEAVRTILADAPDWDVLQIVAWTLAGVLPRCCAEHDDEMMTEFLELVGSATDAHDEMHAEAEAMSEQSEGAVIH